MRKRFKLMMETTITGLPNGDYHAIVELEDYPTYQEARQAVFNRCQRVNAIDEEIKAWMEEDELHSICTIGGKTTRHIWIEEK